MERKTSLLWPVVLLVVLPLIASWFAYPQTHLPPGFGVFPPLFVAESPGFSLPAFILVLLAELVIVLLLLFPRWFGFKPVPPAPRPTPARLPWWFWLGLVMTAFFWWLMWTRVTPFGDLVYFAFTPLWWGFILTLDGIVYRRSGGNSLMASRPKTFIATIAVSLVGWLLFEYLDYFALGNWYYPNSTLPALSHELVVVLFLLAYTTVWPAIFEWFTLLNTFPSFVARYARGPRLALPGTLLIVGGLVLLVLMVFYPYPMFWALWIAALAVFAGILIRAGVANPFTALAEGNWSPMVLMALSSLFNGFFWELWNYGSSHPEAVPVTNPNYWVYNVPYVNVIHLYSEMPLLGYAGYLPFGLLAWVIFLWCGKVFGFDTRLLGSKTASTAPST